MSFLISSQFELHTSPINCDFFLNGFSNILRHHAINLSSRYACDRTKVADITVVFGKYHYIDLDTVIQARPSYLFQKGLCISLFSVFGAAGETYVIRPLIYASSNSTLLQEIPQNNSGRTFGRAVLLQHCSTHPCKGECLPLADSESLWRMIYTSSKGAEQS